MPRVFTNEHHQVFPFWHDSGIRHAVLVHVDAHHDLMRGAPAEIGEPHGYVNAINCGNFICPAAHEGIVDDMYWINPHTERVDYLSSFTLQTIEENGRLNWRHSLLTVPAGEKTYQIPPRAPLILDVDLDAFACDRKVHGIFHPNYDGVKGWERRIDWTMAFLKGLRPDLVTITRSQSRGPEDTYVPPDLVDAVERTFLKAYRVLQ